MRSPKLTCLKRTNLHRCILLVKLPGRGYHVHNIYSEPPQENPHTNPSVSPTAHSQRFPPRQLRPFTISINAISFAIEGKGQKQKQPLPFHIDLKASDILSNALQTDRHFLPRCRSQLLFPCLQTLVCQDSLAIFFYPNFQTHFECILSCVNHRK